jgi:hypothetical protein
MKMKRCAFPFKVQGSTSPERGKRFAGSNIRVAYLPDSDAILQPLDSLP